MNDLGKKEGLSIVSWRKLWYQLLDEHEEQTYSDVCSSVSNLLII